VIGSRCLRALHGTIDRTVIDNQDFNAFDALYRAGNVADHSGDRLFLIKCGDLNKQVHRASRIMLTHLAHSATLVNPAQAGPAADQFETLSVEMGTPRPRTAAGRPCWNNCPD
jgi:hypothetical protein